SGGAGGGGDGAGAGGAAARGGAGGALDAGTERDGGSGGAITGPTCDAQPPPEVPAGWVRFPGLPCECTAWVAPSQALMDTPPPWVQVPGGWLELDDPQAGANFFIGRVLGGSYEGKQQFAYPRILPRSGPDAPRVQENVVLELPEQRYVYQERVVGDAHYNVRCYSGVEALGQGVLLHEAHPHNVTPVVLEVLATTTAAQPVPSPIFRDIVTGFINFGVGEGLAGAGQNTLGVIPLAPPGPYQQVWSFDGRMIANGSVFVWDSTLFFAVAVIGGPFTKQYYTWSAGSGVQPFLGGSPSAPGAHSFMGLGTDGTTLVWTELSDWDGARWQTVALMQAPYTTDAAALKPRRVPVGLGSWEWSAPWVVGGGYAAARIRLGASGTALATYVVRLADGATWHIDQPGVDFSPLYLTETELGATMGYEPLRDGGPDGVTAWRAVRYPLSLLGSPNVP
ncbi:MAG: hypothetical protein OZ921_20230, partial [Sorangiineae bacterium]|nr:hypothetical protein [Sorangiineae bacterium]